MYIIFKLFNKFFFKSKAECIVAKISKPLSSNKATMFEAAGSNNKGHFYGFGSDSGAIAA